MLLILRILAVVGQQKSGGGRFTSPNRSSSFLLTIAEMTISFGKVAIYGRLSTFNTGIVTVVNYCTRHSAKNRLNDIQKLGSGWER